jgi:glycosyltransferase involved in cell wall biosynthesis
MKRRIAWSNYYGSSFMILPTPPTLEEIQAHIPSINPVPEGTPRPFWSVMIPTYNSGHYLRWTLESVLSQDLGPDQMQIEVVDGCSTKDDPEEIVKKVGKGRVTFYRLPSNHGAAHTFNTCIRRSNGRWVHILHGDDMVLHGFYDAYTAVINNYLQAVMVVGGVSTINENNDVLFESPQKDVENVGIIYDFAEQQGFRTKAAFPAVVVRRSAYEAAGGFCTWFHHMIDMDMWLRIAVQGDVVGIRRPVALYRKHSQSDTNGFILSGDNIRERVLLTLVNFKRLSIPGWPAKARSWRQEAAEYASLCAWLADRAGSTRGRLNQAKWVFRLMPGFRNFWFLVKSWFKHHVRLKGA